MFTLRTEITVTALFNLRVPNVHRFLERAEIYLLILLSRGTVVPPHWLRETKGQHSPGAGP